MSNKHLTTAGWVALSATTFALGWALKPSPEISAAEQDSRRELSAVSPEQLSALELPDSRSSRPVELATEFDTIGSRIGTARPLSSAEIQDLGLQLRRELDPIKRRSTFLRLIEGLTAENAKIIREQIADLPANSPAFRDFHYEWGKIGGAEAVMHGAETEKPDMIATLAGWASADPKAAGEWYAGLDKQSKETFANQEYMKMGMVHGLANNDTSLATNFVLARAAAGDRGARQMIGIVSQKIQQAQSPAEAARWAVSLPSDELRGPAMAHVAHGYAQSDPDAAADWARSVADKTGGSQAVGVVSRQLAQRDGMAAIAWVESIEDAPSRHSGYRSAFESWAGKDPAAASQHLVDMPASDFRDSAISGLVNRTRWEEPQAAITWAREIAQPKRREEALVNAGQAFMRRDQNAAREWLSTSGLSQQAQNKITGSK